MILKNRIPNKLILLILSLILAIGLLPTDAYAENPVVTDSTDFDVFMNVDPSLGIDPTVMKTKVSGYLDNLISAGGTSKSYRMNTSAATIDPTDVTKWEVYSRYDSVWYADKAAWQSGYNGGVVPTNWYYYGVTDYKDSRNSKTTIATMLSDKATPPGTGTAWGQTAGLDSHVYAYLQNGKPAMQFYGYGQIASADFLYYPASATSTKTVKFDVDASAVFTHTLKYSGFLINAGTSGSGSSKTMDGYLIIFEYGPAGSTSPATSLTGVYLYKLAGVNVDNFHSSNLSSLADSTTAGKTLVATSAFKTFYTNSHIELSITPTSLAATIQQGTAGSLTGSQSTLFSLNNLVNTGYGGFGPYVDYNSHGCTIASSFRFSSLEMAFSETLSGNSALEAYQYANYLNDSRQRFFVNMTNATATNYAATATDTDNAYLSLMTADKSILITDEYSGTYLPGSLGSNTKSFNETAHVTDGAITSLYSGSAETEKVAAKVAWLIYHATYGTGGTITAPLSIAIASLMLLDGPGTTSGAVWTGASQVNQIKKELMSGDGLKIYLNPDSSQNAGSLAASYTLTYPNGSTALIAPTTDSGNVGKLYFVFPNTSTAGDYKVTLSYATGGSITSTIPASASFSVLSDTTAPTPSATISGSNASLTFTNTAGSGSTAFTSMLASYATVLNTSSSQPSTPGTGSFTAVSGSTATVSLGSSLSTGTYYLHMFLKDAAGNVGYAQRSFTITFTAPTITFTYPETNNFTSLSPYSGASVTFSLSAGTGSIASYKIGTGADAASAAYGIAISATGLSSAAYTLPTGEYRLWIKAIDGDGNESIPINMYVQKLSGPITYYYGIIINKTDRGSVASNRTIQMAGNPVTIAVTPDPGCVFGSLSIHDANGNSITCTKYDEGTYQFTMPSASVTVSAVFVNKIATPAETGVARYLATQDHISYMNGFHNGYFHPEQNMTRAEAAQMFYNLLLNKDVAVTANFNDVEKAIWYEKAVETLASMGIITGYNGSFRPGDFISRDEFTAIAMRFAILTGGKASFSDVSSADWAYSYIMSAAEYGWINGYTDGTYKPEALITRAEVVTIVNNMLGRSAGKDYIDTQPANLKIFPDASSSSYWAYYEIVEATNRHDYDFANGQETWKGLK